MIPHLCTELLLAIGDEIFPADQMALRAVCRDLRSAIEPLFFASTPIIMDLGRILRNVLETKEVATGVDYAGWSKFGRTLVIRSLSVHVLGGPASQAAWVEHHLRHFLKSFRDLRSVHWTLVDSDFTWAQIIVADVLKPVYLGDLHIVNKTSDTIPFSVLAPLSNVRNLCVEGTIDQTFVNWMEKIVKKKHNLEGLRLPSASEGYAALYKTLQKTETHLKGLSVRRSEDALISYLASYSGLEELRIDHALDDDQADLFLTTALQRHKDSLVVLICPGYIEGKWSFGRHNIKLISELRHLITLEMTINSKEMGFGAESGVDIVRSFLEMSTSMVALRNIAILAAISRSSGGCGNAIERGIASTQERIDSAVDRFAAASADPAIHEMAEIHHLRVKAYDRPSMWFRF
ncbi:hypothetical protein B0H11DRAFT_2279789 [Mycena galericulata]|nr:hypothetical protein B0H11DRAFT_2279789 [Mycena galericulata]